MIESMDDANRRDQRTERRLREVQHTLRDLRDDPELRLLSSTRGRIAELEQRLQREADHLVAVWD